MYPPENRGKAGLVPIRPSTYSDSLQAEFQRHMTDIYHIAKGSLENDDDLDCYSQALLGIMEQEQMLIFHTHKEEVMMLLKEL